MVRLADTVGRWLGRVEVVLGGAEAPLREGEEALANGDPAKARAAAREILALVPGSPIGLALLADACDAAGQDDESAAALEELATVVPSRADVWARLGRARAAIGAPAESVRDAYVRALAVAEPGSGARRDALVALADLDLAQGAADRAELWLERVAEPRDPAVAVRRAEARLMRGDAPGALTALGSIAVDAADGRANLALGRARAATRDPGAFAPLLRATILDARGASDALSSALGSIASDDATRARIRKVVDARGETGSARWRAAFARAEGHREEARRALVEATAAQEPGAARALLDAALDDRDAGALAQAVDALGRAPPGSAEEGVLVDARKVLGARAALDTDGERPIASTGTVLEPLGALISPAARAWGADLRAELAHAWVPAKGPARWGELLARLERIARELHDLEASARLASLSAERRRPLRLAIVGEFNAGKSTFINALVGSEIAPTGVLPTTATLHHLRYAPDPIARILFAPGSDPPERIVAVGELRATLRAIDAGTVRRVEILLPLPSLTRVEILDTPGFNAPDPRHVEAARTAFDEADVALWLLDAGQPLKESERAILTSAQSVGLPVQVLVNKSDRLGPDDRARVMASVEAGLADANLVSWTAPRLFSARRALAGKLGDGAALADSGWEAIADLLEREFVGRSTELKERALRRRAKEIVGEMGRAAASRADDERNEDERARTRVEAIGRAAARIERDAETVAARIAEGLARPASAWQAEASLVNAGRAPEALAADVSLQRYHADRALAQLGRPLAQALAGAADGTGVPPADLLPIARATIRAFAGVAPPTSPLLPLTRSAVAALVDHLVALAATPRPMARTLSLVGELSAFAEALAAPAPPEAPAPRVE